MALMTAALPEAVWAAGEPAEVWFQDEARVGQQGTLTYVWAEKGSRPRALKDLRYEWAYLFGAVCAERCVGPSGAAALRQRPRRPMVGMMLHQDASTHAWLPGNASEYNGDGGACYQRNLLGPGWGDGKRPRGHCGQKQVAVSLDCNDSRQPPAWC